LYRVVRAAGDGDRISQMFVTVSDIIRANPGKSVIHFPPD